MNSKKMEKAFAYALNNVSHIQGTDSKVSILENMMSSTLKDFSKEEIKDYVKSEMAVIEKFTPDYYYYA